MPDPDRTAAPIVGIDVGATHMNLAVVDASDRILARTHLKTQATNGLEDVLDRLADATRAVTAQVGLDLDGIAGVGVAVASPVDVPNGIALHAVNLGWRNVPLRDLLSDRLRRPVVIDNDVNGAVWGEYRLGAGQGASGMLGVWVGTGVGGGFVLDGAMYRGRLHTAGEIGHVVVAPHASPDARILEDLTSRTGMSRVIASRLVEFPRSLLRDAADDRGIVPTDRLAEAWEAGDELAGEVIDDAARLLGIAIANCVTLLALDTVVVGGGVTEVLAEPFLDRVRDAFVADVFPEPCRGVRIEMTRLAADAGLLGAALLARESAVFD
jgi:glucokinase